MSNFNFAHKEDAQNFVDNYGGTLYDNTHSKGGSWGQGANSNAYVVHQNDGGSIDYDENDDNSVGYHLKRLGIPYERSIDYLYPEYCVVYHYKYGKGRVNKRRTREDTINGWLSIKFENNVYDYDTSLYKSFSNKYELDLISYTPYTLEGGGFSKDVSNQVIDKRWYDK